MLRLIFASVLSLLLLISCGRESQEDKAVRDDVTARVQDEDEIKDHMPEDKMIKKDYPTPVDNPEELAKEIINKAKGNANLNLADFCHPEIQSPEGSICSGAPQGSEWVGKLGKANIEGEITINDNFANVPVRIGNSNEKYTMRLNLYKGKWYFSNITPIDADR